MASKGEIIERALHALSAVDGVVSLSTVLGVDTGVSVAVGVDEEGKIKRHSVPRLPNLLIGGSTGTGKSNFLHALISSLMLTNTPEEMQFVLFDPKLVEFTVYNGLAHLYNRHVYQSEDMDYILDELYDEMNARFEIFQACGVDNVFKYNEWASEANAEKLPYLIVIADEFMELYTDERIDKTVRVLQKCRSAGIHFILASQAPERCVLVAPLRAYFTTKLIFATATVSQSWALLDKPVAVGLKVGEAYFRPPSGKMVKLKTPYAYFSDVKTIVEILREVYE